MDWNVISSYSFLVVAFGTMLLGVAAGMVGCVNILKRKSLIGDAVGHAAFPGVVLAFMLLGSRSMLVLMLGAVVAGSISFWLIQLLERNSKLKTDTSLAIVLSSAFGLGMVLKSFIQGNPAYAKASQAGLQHYIFGQAAYLMQQDVVIILIASLIAIGILAVFFKEIKMYIFDMEFAQISGFRPQVISNLILIMSMSLIAVGLKAVGAILISSMLIAPGVAALQWSNRFSRVILIAGAVGGFSAWLGTYISTVEKGIPTGPSVVVVMSFLAILSFLFSPKGIIVSRYRRKRMTPS